MPVYMLEAEGDDMIRVDTSGRKEKMVKGSGGHKWETINGEIKEED
jgi:hypothetical protein